MDIWNKYNRYNNYELHPYKKIDGYDGQAWEGVEHVAGELVHRSDEIFKEKKCVVVCFDCYPGVDKKEILHLSELLNPVCIFDMEDYAKCEEMLEEEFRDFITEDRVFGVMCHKGMDAFFRLDRLEMAKKSLGEITSGLVIILGMGAGLLSEGDIYIYCNLTRWEIQLRYRNGMPNWHCNNGQASNRYKYKRGFFIEWRIADRYKKKRYDRFDYMLESEEKGMPKLITGNAFRAGLDQVSTEPFRTEPYFDPGVWGGHWMQNCFSLNSEEKNFAWSFDGVPEENGLNLKFGEIVVKVPAIDLVLYRPEALLGQRVHGRFGAEFPIRFDLLDTMGGGNLSLQVHPLTEYIQDTFGMHYTQDESYYILDSGEDEETYVYLGLKKHVCKEDMARDLELAEKGDIQFPAEKYVNKVPVKKHDHILIPAGTIHCSGKNTMVLEISATPYIFTFKLWDWGRVDLDGKPRPTHIKHGLENIQWERDTDWIYENAVYQEMVISEEEGCKVERTGLHNREFIDTFRYTLTKPVEVDMDDTVHVFNLVDGKAAMIESVAGKFRSMEFHYAETGIIPAKVERYRIVPEYGEVKVIVAVIRR